MRPRRSYDAGVLSKRVLVVILCLLVSGCVGSGLPPTVWPPKNFRLVVEESQTDGPYLHVVRRFQVDATGVVVYGTSSQPLLDVATPASWPVFDRLSIYRLEPKCVRALARRLDQLGISDLVVPASAVATGGGPSLTVHWQAFASRRVLPSHGRLRGPMAEILSVIASHLPPGEAFATEMSRPTVPVLRGAPAPAKDAAAALAAFQERIAVDPDDDDLVLIAYALACSVADRDQAEKLLARWQQLKRSQPRAPGFWDDPNSTLEVRTKSLASMLLPA